MLSRVLALVALGACLGSCSTVDFEALPPATLSGRVVVLWVGEGDSRGDGKFLFVPDPHNPLVFRRKDPNAPGAEIQPGLMYTDGGSVPSIAQAFNGLHPWGYGPAYMIHDWLFTARHCIVDGRDGPQYDQVRTVGFDDSAKILGEAIQGLVAQHQVLRRDLAGDVITSAVASAVAEKLWNERDDCKNLQVSPEDVDEARRLFPRSTSASTLSTFRATATAARRSSRPAKIVADIRL